MMLFQSAFQVAHRYFGICVVAQLGLAAAIVVISGGQQSMADDWPAWLGANGDAIWNEDKVVARFPEGGLPIKWRCKIGPGYTGPSVAKGRVYLMDRIEAAKDPEKKNSPGISRIEGQERVVCLDASTGKTIWEHIYDCPYIISYPSGPRVTPLVDDDRVFTLGAMGNLICFEAATGKVIWQTDLKEQFNTKPPVWGYAAHPLLDENRLVLPVGGEGSAVVALDKQSGKEIWRSLTAEEVGYAPVVIYSDGTKKQLVFWHDSAVHGLDPLTGKNLWTEPFPESGDIQRPAVTIATPRVDQNRLLISDFYHGSLMLRLSMDPPGAEVLWGPDPEDPGHENGLNVLMATPFMRDGKIYGTAGNGEMRCLDAATGKIDWRNVQPTGDGPADFATCFVVKQADRFFLFNDQGYLIVARMTPQGYEELDRTKLLEPVSFARGRNIVWSHPAFADRCVFARNDAEVVCADLAESS